MLTLIERTREEKITALQAIEEHLRIQLMNVRAEIRELQLAGVKQSAPVTTTSPTPEPAQPAIVTNEEDIKVVWETPLTGYTLDDTGIKRTFTVQRWDDMRPTPVIELTTSDDKIISSAWRTIAIRKNRHFQAIEKSYMPHFFQQVELLGYQLKDSIKMGCDASFKVFKDGKEMGIIGFDSYLWFLGNRSVYAWKKYGSVTEVLAALESEATAKVEIGL